MLKRLHLEHVGPASVMDVEFADRLNVFTGDNGLGKTFLLDIAWWIFGAEGIAPSPKQGWQNLPKIEFELNFGDGIERTQFEAKQQDWCWRPIVEVGMEPPILGVYAKLDGSFAIFDSLRLTRRLDAIATILQSLELSVNALWNGLKADERVLCNGLIADWVRWQNQPDQYNFQLLWSIIEKLFPAEERPKSGQPTRTSLTDVRDIPTIQLAYGMIPITQLSSGMKRILNFAYILVWVWSEHRQAAQLANSPTAGKLLLLVDEMEAHLHPKWQRSIFPAILEAIKLLNPNIQVQVLTTTHSPLVLASLEPYFDGPQDQLFGFDVVDREVILEEVPWVKLGEVDDWLTSPIFGLSRPRSKEAEVAINAAYAIMRNADMSEFPSHLRDQDSIHQELLRVLPDHDSFWHRWIVTAGVRN